MKKEITYKEKQNITHATVKFLNLETESVEIIDIDFNSKLKQDSNTKKINKCIKEYLDTIYKSTILISVDNFKVENLTVKYTMTLEDFKKNAIKINE